MNTRSGYSCNNAQQRRQAATGSWTKARQWETERTLFSSARATMCPPAKVNGVWPFNDAWLRTSLSEARRQAPRNGASILDAAREFGIRDAQEKGGPNHLTREELHATTPNNAVTGLRVLTFFGVSVAAVQIAGGLILVRVAFDLLRGEASLTVTCADEADQRIHRGDEFVAPYGVARSRRGP